jgi:transcriptional regulator with GAF, ATPase, and Fis domain
VTWIVDVDNLPRTNKIARVMCARCAGLRLVDVPDHREVTGVVLGRSDSGELYRVLVEAVESGTQVIVVATDDAQEPWPVLAAGAADLLVWNGDPHEVSARLERLDEIERLVVSPTVAGVIRGASAGLRTALRDLVTTARFGSGPILLLGETGTGKELAARVAHAVGPRAGHLVVVDCTTIVPTLSGSELFGHERGAFTGAMSMRTGAFAAANGGTLLLDEIGELPLALQPELLRVIQEGTFKRVGADTWQHADFRLICATNRLLEDEVAAGRFRADFYYRIAASTIRLPPLRERAEDVVGLFKGFLAEACGRTDPVELTPAVTAAVQDRDYPGNLRDLRQLAGRVAARHVGPGPVTPGDLPPGDRPAHPVSRTVDYSSFAELIRAQLRQGKTLKELREHVADVAVSTALEEAGGSVRAAAARLGITDRALHLRRAQRRGPASAAASSA